MAERSLHHLTGHNLEGAVELTRTAERGFTRPKIDQIPRDASVPWAG
jgi:hypothetical protein